MKRQTLKIDRKSSIVIETPLGMITIEYAGSPRNFAVLLPDGLTAHRTMQRAVDSARFLTRGEDGQLRPRYQMLVPKVGEHGEILGVDTPPVFRVAKTG